MALLISRPSFVKVRTFVFVLLKCYSLFYITAAIEDINKYRPKDIILADTRAHQLLVIYTDGWYAIPSLEIFSRHSGTCVVIGDRKFQGRPYPMKLGDCFRLGSVGLVVSEMKSTDGTERRLDTRHLQYLREEALAFDTEQEEACLAATEGEELRDGRTSPVARTQVAMSERFICYMCYETHDTPNDQLVAPCDCKGDTRYLHVQCLQKWYQTSVCGPRAQVITVKYVLLHHHHHRYPLLYHFLDLLTFQEYYTNFLN